MLLTLLPTVMSQRLLLVNLMVASFVGYSLAQGRITGIKYILLGAITVAAVWTLREYFAFRHVFPSASIGELSGQKAMYYVLNDYFNILNPIVQVDPGYTKGAFMLQGPSFYVMMTDLWEDYMVYERTIVDSLIGGGELPFFTQQYVDLGLFAFPFIAILGFVIGVLYRRAQSDIRYVIFYAILSPGLVLSVHSFQYVHQNTIFHLVIAFIFATLLSRSTVR